MYRAKQNREAGVIILTSSVQLRKRAHYQFLFAKFSLNELFRVSHHQIWLSRLTINVEKPYAILIAPILSAMNAACNGKYSNVPHIFSIILTDMNSEREWHSQFFFSGPRTVGLALAVSSRTTASYTGNKRFRLATFFHIFFWMSRLQLLQGLCVNDFTQVFDDLTA